MASLAPPIKFSALDATGNPAAGFKVYFFAAGTSTPKDTYTSRAATTANTNPVILDARGEATVWLSGSYKVRLTTAADVLVYEEDDVSDGTLGGTFTNATFSGTLTISSTAVTWSGNPTHSGNHTFSGNVSLNGNTTIGNASGDSLTVAPSAVTWSNNPTHSGDHTFSGDLTVGGDFTATTTPIGFTKAAYKTASTARSSATTVSDDPHLSVALTAGTWDLECLLPVWATTGGAGGFKFTFDYSGSSSNEFFVSALNVAGVTAEFSSVPFATTVSAGTISVSTGVVGGDFVRASGSFIVTTSGNLTVQWAQNSSNANAANVGNGAFLKATRLA
jgi:hypothetical protein